MVILREFDKYEPEEEIVKVEDEPVEFDKDLDDTVETVREEAADE